MAGRAPGGSEERAGRGDARPLVPRRRLHAHVGGRRRAGRTVRGRIRRLRAGQGRAGPDRPGRGRAPPKPHAQRDRLAAARPARTYVQAEVPHRRRTSADRERAAGPRDGGADAVRGGQARQDRLRPRRRHPARGRPRQRAAGARPPHVAVRPGGPDRADRRQRLRQVVRAAAARRHDQARLGPRDQGQDRTPGSPVAGAGRPRPDAARAGVGRGGSQVPPAGQARVDRVAAARTAGLQG